jgi:hypothetical protein
MKKELLLPYKSMILRCIESCVNPEQLLVCHDMMDRFSEQFMHCADTRDILSARDELSAAYLQKQAELGF